MLKHENGLQRDMQLLMPILCVNVQVWNTHTGEELHTLEGHKNVVRGR